MDIPLIEFSDKIFSDLHPRQTVLSSNVVVGAKLARSQSTTEFSPLDDDNVVEYLFASDASAIIEHTNRVIFLEDDDVASVADGRKLSLSSKL
jgi:glucosamine--fructose-6-phosphate aminotransferase (isomerizing)